MYQAPPEVCSSRPARIAAMVRDPVREYLAKIGKRGGLAGGPKGGRARAEALTPERRREIARKAVLTRWKRERAAVREKRRRSEKAKKK
jgi:hypothetical protein